MTSFYKIHIIFLQDSYMLLLVNACLQCVPFLSTCKNINKCSFYKKNIAKRSVFLFAPHRLHRTACTAPRASPLRYLLTSVDPRSCFSQLFICMA